MAWHVNDLDAKFVAHLEKLKEVAASQGDAVCLANQRMWYMPPLEGWSGDPSDILGMDQAFDRDELNAAYVAVVSDTTQQGRIGEAMLVKIQLDYIATLERSFRTRQASSIRCKMHAAGRRKGHGASGGLYDTSNGNIAMWLTRILAAAHAG